MTNEQFHEKVRQALNMADGEYRGMITIVQALGIALSRLGGANPASAFITSAKLLTTKNLDAMTIYLARNAFRQIQLVKRPSDPPEYKLAIQANTGDLFVDTVPLLGDEQPDVSKAAAIMNDGDAYGFLLYPQSLPCGRLHTGPDCPACKGAGELHSLYAGLGLLDTLAKVVDEYGLPDDPLIDPFPIEYIRHAQA